jgi:diacylglycerol kinase family enzyme
VPPLHALVRQVVRIDVALFDRVARSRGRVLDHVLPRLTRAANHSRIWLAAATLLAALGGRRGKRAAIRGVGSISVTSLVVNQVVKRLVRRPRPALRHVPVARRLDAQPLTTSFPSGHAAALAAWQEGNEVVVNRDAGSPLGGPDAEELRRRLPRARIVVVDDPAELPDALGEAAGDCRTLGISGGDGSIATAAAVALERDKPLLVIPAGTLNHLGRDLRVESADDALAALASGQGLRIDVGLIDGRPFVNTASFGGYTTMLEVRESLQKRIGRWPAHLAAVATAALRAEPLELELDGRRRRAWMVFAGNCRHEPSGFAPSWRPRLDDGLLDVRILSGEAPLARLRLLASVLTGRLTRSVAYEQRCVARLGVRTSSDSLTLARDGDSFEGSGSFELRKLPRGLAVYAPTDAR